MDKKETFKFWLPIILSIIALILSVISISYTVHHNSIIKELTFANNGFQKRPLLQFEEKIDKIHYTLESKPIDVYEMFDKIRQKQNPNFLYTIKVDPEMSITNEGGAVAKVILKIVTDKYSGLPEIRKNLLTETWDSFSEVRLTENFFKTMDILPAKSYPIRLPYTINDINFENSEFTIHYLIVYMNDIGNIYDSYFWIRFKMRPLEMRISGTEENHQISLANMDGAFKVVDTHFQTYMYSYDESKKIIDLHKKYQKKFRQLRD